MKKQDKELLLKALCGYLPYDLQMKHVQEDYNFGMPINLTERFYSIPAAILTNFKPILRPLKNIKAHELEDFFNTDYIIKGTMEILKIKSASWHESIFSVRFKHIEGIGLKDGYFYTEYGIGLASKYTEDQFEYLYSKHIDVKGLIQKNLAIDINTLEQ